MIWNPVSHFIRNKLGQLPIVMLFIAILSSCTNILYKESYDSDRSLDFTSGLWLLNEIEIVNSGQSDVDYNSAFREGFDKIGVKSITYIGTAGSISNLPKEIPFYTEPEMLKSIKDSSGYDYLINVKSNIFGHESGGLAFGEQTLENRAGIEIIIFDIKLGSKLYYQETIASETWPMHDEMEEVPYKFSFTRSSENLIKNTIERSLRALKKNSKKLTWM